MIDFDSTDATDLADSFESMVRAASGTDLARAAEADPATRTRVATLLEDVGAWDIAPLDNGEQALYASALCHRSGALNLPYPVAERLTATQLDSVDACAVLSPAAPVIAHGGLELRWAGMHDGTLRQLTEQPGAGVPTRIAPFAMGVSAGGSLPDTELGRRETLYFLLTGFVLLGACDTAAADTYRYAGTRRQFGAPIGSFQGLRFSLTDVATALQGAHELGLYALWSFSEGRPEALEDALTFRIAILEAADITFARCHQAYGAIGLCDETDLSWLSRHSRALRHIPWGLTRTEQRLLELSPTAAVVGPFSA